MPNGALEVRSLPPNQTIDLVLKMTYDASHYKPTSPHNCLQVAVKNNFGIHYFQTFVPFYVYFEENGKVGSEDFLNNWKGWNDSHFTSVEFQCRNQQDIM